MKNELLFEIGTEGGDISIYRDKKENEIVYSYHQNETDFSEEMGDISTRLEFSSFLEAFNKINRFPWYCFSLSSIHPEFKDVVINELLLVLNALDEKEIHNFSSKDSFEKVLNVRFLLDEKKVFTGLYEIDAHAILLNDLKQSITSLNTEGKIEIRYNSILIKDREDKIEFILPSDKFVIETKAIIESKFTWSIE